jgi:GTP-binding protein
MFRYVKRSCDARQLSRGSIAEIVESVPAAVVPKLSRTTDLMNRLVTKDTESFPLLIRDFEDRRRITFRSGKGGNPAPNTVRGQRTNGPAFGGHGGSIILRGSEKLESLVELPKNDMISADAGGDGSGTSRGIHARDRVIEVPLGTIVRERVKTDRKTSEGRTIYAPRYLYQFLRDGDSIVLCNGGKGGVAPVTFKKGDGRKGSNGEKKSVDLELRILNDCALLGIPNSGKSSIISSLTSTLTRIGPEPYSTTRPHLGTLQFRDGLSVKLLDLPGIAEGAAGDKQRGIRVLRHTYRSRLLIYCIDISNSELDPFSQLELLRKEVGEFDAKNFESRKELVIATKCDMLHRDTLVNLDSLYYRIRSRIGEHVPVVGTSARFGLGINRLVHHIRQQLFPDAIDLMRPRISAELVHSSISVRALASQ